MQTLRDWLITFGMIIVRPLARTYVSEAAKSNGKFPSAVAWMVFYAIVLQVNGSLLGDQAFSVPLTLVAILLLPLAILLFVFCLQFVYRRVFSRAEDHYDELLYLVVGNFVPFAVVSCLYGVDPRGWACYGQRSILLLVDTHCHCLQGNHEFETLAINSGRCACGNPGLLRLALRWAVSFRGNGCRAEASLTIRLDATAEWLQHL